MAVETEKKQIMTEIVATNVLASWSPERGPTAVPTALANNIEMLDILQKHKLLYIKAKFLYTTVQCVHHICQQCSANLK